jgi:hypothetical protein
LLFGMQNYLLTFFIQVYLTSPFSLSLSPFS